MLLFNKHIRTIEVCNNICAIRININIWAIDIYNNNIRTIDVYKNFRIVEIYNNIRATGIYKNIRAYSTIPLDRSLILYKSNKNVLLSTNVYLILSDFSNLSKFLDKIQTTSLVTNNIYTIFVKVKYSVHNFFIIDN